MKCSQVALCAFVVLAAAMAVHAEETRLPADAANINLGAMRSCAMQSDLLSDLVRSSQLRKASGDPAPSQTYPWT